MRVQTIGAFRPDIVTLRGPPRLARGTRGLGMGDSDPGYYDTEYHGSPAHTGTLSMIEMVYDLINPYVCGPRSVPTGEGGAGLVTPGSCGERFWRLDRPRSYIALASLAGAGYGLYSYFSKRGRR
jgi:hypothetical protein